MLKIFISILVVASSKSTGMSPFEMVAPKYLKEYQNLMRLLSSASVESHPVQTRGRIESDRLEKTVLINF